jgi:predicted neuraminidase
LILKTTFLALTLAALAAVGVSAEPFYESELIFTSQGKHVHGSSIVECPNGDLLAAWFYGSGERSADDVMIQGARLVKGEKQWSAVFEMADTPNLPDCNPTLFIDSQSRLWLIWIVVQANRWEHSILKYRISEDYQEIGAPKWNWQDIILLQPGSDFPKDLEEGFKQLDVPNDLWGEYARAYDDLLIEAAQEKIKRQSGWMTRISPITLSTGRIVLPLYSDGYNLSLMALSDDRGETWRASKPIVGLGNVQPSVVEKKNGTLVAYMRDNGNAPHRVIHATSDDQGETWTVGMDTDLPNPGASVAAISLEDGRWVMALNDTEKGRHQIAFALSDDEGATWKWKRHADKAEPGTPGSFAYPSLCKGTGGLVHASYSHKSVDGASIKHVCFDPDWIKGE